MDCPTLRGFTPPSSPKGSTKKARFRVAIMGLLRPKGVRMSTGQPADVPWTTAYHPKGVRMALGWQIYCLKAIRMALGWQIYCPKGIRMALGCPEAIRMPMGW